MRDKIIKIMRENIYALFSDGYNESIEEYDRAADEIIALFEAEKAMIEDVRKADNDQHLTATN